MNRCIIEAPAKINLFLDITGKRDDGYHNIISIMQSVSLKDRVELGLRSDRNIVVNCGNSSIPHDRKNIAYRAAEFFAKRALWDSGVTVTIDKKIPVSAGLAGGSADAAAVLRGLNILSGNRFDTDELCEMASYLGADVPFCVRCGCMKAEGTGELLIPLDSMPECYIVISCPQKRVSTPEAYSELDRIYSDFHNYIPDNRKYGAVLSGLESCDLGDVCGNMFNIFESTVNGREDITEIKNIMQSAGVKACMMSGSGPSVFGIFENRHDADKTEKILGELGFETFGCVPYNMP